MWLLADTFVTAFTPLASPRGWQVDHIDDDEYIVYSRQLGLGMVAELGLDLTRREWGLSLNPAISVRSRQVSDLHARFFGFERGASQAGASLSDLVRDAGLSGGVMWTVESADEVGATAHKVLSDVDVYGGPFYSRYSSLEDVVRYLEGSARTNLDHAQLAVALALSGDMNRAVQIVSDLEEGAGEQPGLVAAQTMTFVESFREHFAAPS